MGSGRGRGDGEGGVGNRESSLCFCVGSPCLCFYLLCWVIGVGLAVSGGIIMGVVHNTGPEFPPYMWGVGVGLLAGGCCVVAGCIAMAVLICLGFVSLDKICDKTPKYEGSSTMHANRYPQSANAYSVR